MKKLTMLVSVSLFVFAVFSVNAMAAERVFSYETETEYVGQGVVDFKNVTAEQCLSLAKNEGRCGYYTWYPIGAPSLSSRYSAAESKYTRCILMMGPFKKYTKRPAISGMIQ